MAGKFFILQDVADFAPGFFENTAVEGGCVQLLQQEGGYPETGSYTSPPFDAEDFFSLTPSWNANCPPGTAVEMQVRVAADGHWSRWFSFGRWSPWQDNAAPTGEADDIARGEKDALWLQDGNPAADVVQMRVFLYTDDGALTPQVWLMAVATNAAQQMAGEAAAYDRQLELPAYSCQVRDPALSLSIASATTLCMLMNRWGRDLLPEEVARAAWDAGGGFYGNLAFLAATAGMQGFSCHISYAGMSALRREVWEGRCVGARVHYRAAALPGLDPEPRGDGPPLAPVLEGAVTSSQGHLLAVRGFFRRDGKEYVLVNDPLAQTDETAPAEIPLAAFAKIYTGLALFVRPGPAGSGSHCPQRQVARLACEGDSLQLSCEGRPLIPGGIDAGEPATLCYTLFDGTAFAQQAQKHFFYVQPGEDGQVHIEGSAAEGMRLTFYLIATRGRIYVGEKIIDKMPEKLLDKCEENDLENEEAPVAEEAGE